jgi:glycosyltransferase involved in cell wall biosynthesis
MKTRLIVIGPLPPPHHGVTISTRLVLASPQLNERLAVEHLDTSDHRTTSNTGRWEPRNVLIALRSLIRLHKRLGGDRGVVYLPLSQGTPALVRDCLFIQLAERRGWKVAAHLRGGEFNDVYARQTRPIRRLLRSSLGRLHSVAVLGTSLRPLFDGLLPAERVVVVPNGTPDLDLNGGTRHAKTGLFLSNLRRRKGVREALEAALLVLREDPSACFVFVGEWEDAELERGVRRRAQAAGDGIRFLPVATGEAHRDALRSAGFLLFPPVEPEGHPRVVLEALAAGLPVVTTDRGAIAETVVDGESGFVLAEPEPRDLAERMLRLVREPELRQRMSDAARATYVERFKQESADRRLASWLERVALDLDPVGG